MPELTKNRCSLSSKQSSTLTKCASVFFTFDSRSTIKKKKGKDGGGAKKKKKKSFIFENTKKRNNEKGQLRHRKPTYHPQYHPTSTWRLETRETWKGMTNKQLTSTHGGGWRGGWDVGKQGFKFPSAPSLSPFTQPTRPHPIICHHHDAPPPSTPFPSTFHFPFFLIFFSRRGEPLPGFPFWCFVAGPVVKLRLRRPRELGDRALRQAA